MANAPQDPQGGRGGAPQAPAEGGRGQGPAPAGRGGGPPQGPAPGGRGGAPQAPVDPKFNWPAAGSVLNTPVKRVDGPDKVTGRAKYTFDIARPGMLYGRIVR